MLRLLSNIRLGAPSSLAATKVSEHGSTEALFLDCISKVCRLF
jgi:hypothetical protein